MGNKFASAPLGNDCGAGARTNSALGQGAAGQLAVGVDPELGALDLFAQYPESADARTDALSRQGRHSGRQNV